MLVVNLVRVLVFEPKCCGYASAPRPAAFAGVHKEGGGRGCEDIACGFCDGVWWGRKMRKEIRR